MNQAKEAFRQVLSKMPKGGGGAGGGPQGSAIASMVQSVAILGGVGYLGYNSFFTVPPGHKAVVWNRYSGLTDKVEGEGLIFRVSARGTPGERRAACGERRAACGVRRAASGVRRAVYSATKPTALPATRLTPPCTTYPLCRPTYHPMRARRPSRFRSGSTPTSATCAPGRATCSR